MFDCIVAAIDTDHTCTNKEAAHAFRLADDTYLSKIKKGERPEPRIRSVSELPEETQRAACQRWARQLKMQVTTEDRRRAALEVLEVVARAVREIA